ncbi:MAG: adenylate/guanylate cyclase domain-containing protein [Nitrospirota bacterium]
MTAVLHDHPLASRCVVCGTPLAGPASVVFRLMGIGRSSRNPSLCTRCGEHVVEGRISEITVLFADLSDFTELTRALGPERTHEVLDTFLRTATTVLVGHGAFIDKYLGDGVMAFFNVPIQREDHAAQAVQAALEIRARLPELRDQFGLPLHAGSGIASGWARVGRLGSSSAKDFTAVGEVVNLAARLEAAAGPGEVVVDRTVYERVASDHPQAVPEALPLKGFQEPVDAYRLMGQPGAHPARQPPASREGLGQVQALGLGAVVFALLGAPCAVFTLIGPWAVGLGIGGLFSAASSYWVLDESPVRLPLLALAALGAAANLYTVWHAGRLRRLMPLVSTGLDRRRTLLVAGSSALTLLVVLFEMAAHRFYHS